MGTLDTQDLKGVLFDADGTLIDTYDIILTSMRHTVNALYGGSYSDEELMAGVGTPLYDQMLTFAQGDEDKAKEMTADYRIHNDATHDAGIRSFPGTAEALEQLKKAGYLMGVVTSKRHAMAVQGLKLTGILDYFSFVIGSDDWPEHKPQPGPILHGCDLLDVAPEHCVYVGDSPYDIQAGNAAGCQTIAALWGMFPESELMAEQPNVACKNLGEVAQLLCGNASTS